MVTLQSVPEAVIDEIFLPSSPPRDPVASSGRSVPLRQALKQLGDQIGGHCARLQVG
jgi:hypothetical protein